MLDIGIILFLLAVIGFLIIGIKKGWFSGPQDRIMTSLHARQKDRITYLEGQLREAERAACTLASWYGVEHPECHQFDELVEEARSAWEESQRPSVH